MHFGSFQRAAQRVLQRRIGGLDAGQSSACGTPPCAAAQSARWIAPRRTCASASGAGRRAMGRSACRTRASAARARRASLIALSSPALAAATTTSSLRAASLRRASAAAMAWRFMSSGGSASPTEKGSLVRPRSQL